MDVVIKNIEKLRGQVDILTRPNEGTTITMKIPLTMAIHRWSGIHPDLAP